MLGNEKKGKSHIQLDVNAVGCGTSRTCGKFAEIPNSTFRTRAILKILNAGITHNKK